MDETCRPRRPRPPFRFRNCVRDVKGFSRCDDDYFDEVTLEPTDNSKSWFLKPLKVSIHGFCFVSTDF